ncbi:MAG: rhodanese-like domain-containing protein [Pirellulales bacterium]|nr:rhodanese-like domain-containing protein [Pirellulales bacterium]
MQTIAPRELASKQEQSSVEIIDVRTPVEFREVHATGAINRPLDRLDPQEIMKGRNGTADQTLYVICQSGSRAAQACKKFLDAGYDGVVSVEGGTEAWIADGLPVKRGKKAISLERQVRIAAGSLVLIGAILAIFIHPYFAGLSAFIGAGLVFAGVTDTCGMGMMLAKMPWNQVRECSL